MPEIFLDIETLPSSSQVDIDEIAARIKPPGNLKKPETIAAWERDDKPAILAQKIKETSFDGTYGRVCAVGLAFDNEPAFCFIGDDEAKLLEQVRSTIHGRAGQVHDRTVVIGHNVLWDLRFLWQRMVVNGIAARGLRPWHAKPWDEKVRDTMQIWNPDRERRISLDRLCRILGVQSPKGDMEGSKIAEAWQQERFFDIEEYCRGDVEAVRRVYRRLNV